MPSFISSRTYSWPPSPTHLSLFSLANQSGSKSTSSSLPDMDDDPFAHFLTPVSEEDDPYDALSFSAGIIQAPEPVASKTSKFTNTVAQKWARYVARHHTDLAAMYHGSPDDLPANNDDDDEAFILDMDDARLDESPRARDLLSTPAITLTQGSGSPTRGRAQELLVPGRRVRRGRGSQARQRRSWREPSPELFTVAEVEEAESPVRERKKRGEEVRRIEGTQGGWSRAKL